MRLWTAEQERLLQAMGFTPYARAGAPPAFAEPVAAAVLVNAGGFDLLRAALRRAAGDCGIDALVGDLARLRKDPAGKRALWPKLRALRRAGSPSGARGRTPEAPDA
ncbi:hypothetical protein [Arenimonas sp.]|uniref:hypothetical protein n=1 Tax=Arenimonas sp. TaxID=1872635 RepID=UPI0039E51455